MPGAQLEIVSPPALAESVQAGPLRAALDGIAALLDAELSVSAPAAEKPEYGTGSGAEEAPIRYGKRRLGAVRCRGAGGPDVARIAAATIVPLLEHALDRETAVEDLASAMVTSYEELNMLYSLLPSMSTRVSEGEIAEVLVEEAVRMLRCRRVSLMLLDEESKTLRVAAARGLPSTVQNVSIPIAGTVSELAMFSDDPLVVNHSEDRPERAGPPRGCYDTAAFVVCRVPLRAQGQALGVLAATERMDAEEFTARDRKLLEGLSAMGASALLNCRLHAAASRRLMSTIRALASAVDAKDEYTHNHSARVASLCVGTARALGIDDSGRLREIELAGMLHDIGKIGIPDAILTKSGRLTGEEFTIIKTHVQIGANIVDHVEGLKGVARAILHHHERHDGLGYPDGLAGDAIPIGSRLIAVADTHDSLTSSRPYREATSPAEARRILVREAGTQLDPDVVQAFLRLIDGEPAGSAEPPPATAERRDLCGAAP